MSNYEPIHGGLFGYKCIVDFAVLQKSIILNDEMFIVYHPCPTDCKGCLLFVLYISLASHYILY
jgi:hypothetical protein